MRVDRDHSVCVSIVHLARLFCRICATSGIFLSVASAVSCTAQLTPADYDRALNLRDKYKGLVIHLPDEIKWIEDTDQFVYRRSISGGEEFVRVDAGKQTTQLAFDHARLAEALTKAFGIPIKPNALPLERYQLIDKGNSLTFTRGRERWRCDLSTYACARRFTPEDADDDDEDGGYDSTPHAENGIAHAVASPDGNWLAFVENYNIALRPAHSKTEDAASQTIMLSSDGSEGDYYAIQTIAWAPDSKHLAIYRIRPGYKREVHYVESSPADQLQPKSLTMVYPKPGDVLSLYQPVLFELAAHRELSIDNALFPNPYELLDIAWWKDSRGFTFEYNRRGHQLYRVIEVNAKDGSARTTIEEKSDTFINYEPLTRNQFDHGKHYRLDLDDGKQIIWASERDGWEHLYLFNGQTGALIHQITHGDWVVRAVDYVDKANHEIYFEASGMNSDEDPYYVHGYKISFDGTGLTPLTPEKADHTLKYSKDGKYFVDTYSRLDLPPIVELHRASDGTLLMAIDKADDGPLRAAGWRPAEPFHSAGRDGKTQIWGVIHKPMNFDPANKYPVIEDIYAGPQGSFVPKSFSSRAEPLTALGFVVVQIDGMGTNNRSRAFHDVAWHNLKDAGFPDRILWHKAVAVKYPWYDISRVGIFGTSSGGQSAMGALLFHPEFYKVAVANSGSHDNRMDKIWWNEQWMGWPIGPWYAESSNAENAWRLKGKLMLVVGEMDKNVDPSSTFQVVDRLIKAGKDFELLFVPGGGHGAGGRYGERKLMDFFVHNVLDQSTPNWNAGAPANPPSAPAF
jgi:dipeptidyl aminopeptidase/acylaminoacyl peptidase